MAHNFTVKVNKKLGIQKALKKFKSKFAEYEIREELMRRREYLKPSVVKRKQKMDAIRENKRLVEEQKREDGLR